MANKFKKTNVKLVDLKEGEPFEKGAEYIFIKSKAIKNGGGKEYDYYDELSGKVFKHDGRFLYTSEIFLNKEWGFGLTVLTKECKKVIREHGGRK